MPHLTYRDTCIRFYSNVYPYRYKRNGGGAPKCAEEVCIGIVHVGVLHLLRIQGTQEMTQTREKKNSSDTSILMQVVWREAYEVQRHFMQSIVAS